MFNIARDSVLRWASQTKLSIITGGDHNRLVRILLFAVWIAAAGVIAYNILTLDSWLDEGNYLMKGYWYVTGQTRPYSSDDATSYMPIMFYIVGPAQLIFGQGYYSGRIIVALLSVPSLILTYFIGKFVGKANIAGVASVLLLVGQPLQLTYFATATPYGVVDTLSLLMVWILLKAKSRTTAYIAAGIILWALVFIRPNMLAITFIPMAWAFFIESRRRLQLFGLTLVVTVVASAGTLAIFGHGLIEVFKAVPGVKQIVQLIDLPPAPVAELLPITTSSMDRAPDFEQAATQLVTYFVEPNSIVIALSMFLILIRMVRFINTGFVWKVKPIDIMTIYFWLSAVLHFGLTLNYCMSCMTTYTLYFLPIGALSVAGLCAEFAGLRASSFASSSVVSGMMGAAVYMSVFPVFPDHLRPQSVQVRETANALSQQLRGAIDPGEHVALFFESAALPQAIWLVGGVVESRTINLPFSHREPLADLGTNERLRAEELIWRSDMWSLDTMRQAVALKYQALIVERRQKYAEPLLLTLVDGVPFGDLLDRYYLFERSFAADGRTFDLFRRRE